MSDDGRRAYWDRVAHAKPFGHPLSRGWLEAFVARDALVLDCGCGYGRLVAELGDRGRGRVVGLDFSEAMLRRARDERGARRLALGRSTSLPFADASFDVTLGFAVLTCVPEEERLARIVDEWSRVTRPGGCLIVSDCALGDDERNRARYAEHAAAGLPYGTFDLAEGARFRHFDPDAFEQRLGAFEVVARRRPVVSTMNGHEQPAFQLVARRL